MTDTAEIVLTPTSSTVTVDQLYNPDVRFIYLDPPKDRGPKESFGSASINLSAIVEAFVENANSVAKVTLPVAMREARKKRRMVTSASQIGVSASRRDVKRLTFPASRTGDPTSSMDVQYQRLRPITENDKGLFTVSSSTVYDGFFQVIAVDRHRSHDKIILVYRFDEFMEWPEVLNTVKLNRTKSGVANASLVAAVRIERFGGRSVWTDSSVANIEAITEKLVTNAALPWLASRARLPYRYFFAPYRPVFDAVVLSEDESDAPTVVSDTVREGQFVNRIISAAFDIRRDEVQASLKAGAKTDRAFEVNVPVRMTVTANSDQSVDVRAMVNHGTYLQAISTTLHPQFFGFSEAALWNDYDSVEKLHAAATENGGALTLSSIVAFGR